VAAAAAAGGLRVVGLAAQRPLAQVKATTAAHLRLFMAAAVAVVQVL